MSLKQEGYIKLDGSEVSLKALKKYDAALLHDQKANQEREVRREEERKEEDYLIYQAPKDYEEALKNNTTETTTYRFWSGKKVTKHVDVDSMKKELMSKHDYWKNHYFGLFLEDSYFYYSRSHLSLWYYDFPIDTARQYKQFLNLSGEVYLTIAQYNLLYSENKND